MGLSSSGRGQSSQTANEIRGVPVGPAQGVNHALENPLAIVDEIINTRLLTITLLELLGTAPAIISNVNWGQSREAVFQWLAIIVQDG